MHNVELCTIKVQECMLLCMHAYIYSKPFLSCIVCWVAHRAPSARWSHQHYNTVELITQVHVHKVSVSIPASTCVYLAAIIIVHYSSYMLVCKNQSYSLSQCSNSRLLPLHFRLIAYGCLGWSITLATSLITCTSILSFFNTFVSFLLSW